MIKAPTEAERRQRRKDDLLLASAVLRLQAADALAALGGRTDAVLNLGLQARAFVARPAVRWLGIGAGVALIVGWAVRRRRGPARVASAAPAPAAVAASGRWRAGAERAWRLGWIAWRAARWVQQWQARPTPGPRG